MHLIVVFDIIFFLASLTALIILLTSWKSALGRDIRLLLAMILVFTLFYSFCLVLEWSGITKALDPLEDITGALLPMLWAFLFYAFLQKMTAHDLSQSEERFRDISYSIADWIWEVDKNGRYIFSSGKVKEILGYDPEELIGKTSFDLMPEDEVKRIGEAFKIIVAEKKPIVDLENWNLTKEGDRVCLLTNGIPILDDRGELSGYRGVDKNITQQKLTEEEVKKRHDLETKLIQSSIDGIVGVDTKGGITLFNKAAEKIIGYSQNEVVGKINVEALYPTGLARGLNKQLKGQEYGGPGLLINYETEVLHKDGRHIPVGVSGSLLYDNSKLIGSVGYFHDMTLKKQTMEKLQESEEKYRNILENIEEAYYEMDNAGNFTFFNNSLCELLGYTREELTGMNNKQTMDNKEAGKLYQIAKEVYITGEPARVVDWKIIGKNGTKKIVEGSASLMKNAEGKRTGFRGIIRDVTKHKQAEEELKTRQTYLESVLYSAPDAIVTLDASHRILEWNPGAEQIFGYTPNEALDQDLDDLVTGPDVIDESKTFTLQVLSGGKILPRETVRYGKDGSPVNVIVAGSPIIVRDELQGVVAVYTDITERKQAEEELKKAKIAAEEASQAKGEFLANMSHEIRTPMNAIMGMTNLALATVLTREQREYLEMVKMSADSLLSLINDILDFSKIEAGQFELEEIDFDLRTTLENAAETLAVKADEASLELVCHIKPDVPITLVGDPAHLRQIIVNLAGNAIKFTKEGEVVIHVDTEKEEDSLVLLHFMVSDTGIGIPPDKMDTIFESFRQADGSITRKYGGTGLGLNISRQLVEMMDGRIWVESELDKGSTFHFTARFRLSDKKTIDALNLRDLDLSGMPVLIVDDNATNRLILCEMTSSWGLVPTNVRNGEKALAEMKRAFDSGSPYRLVLLDLQMPDMDGFEVARRLKESDFGKDTEIILLTSAGRRGDASRCKDVGISGYLVKPLKQSELFDAINLSLGHPIEEKIPVITHYTIQESHRRLNILLAEDNIVNQKLAVKILEKRGHSVVVASNGKEAIEKLKGERFDLVLMDVQMPEMDGLEATRQIRNPKSAIPGPDLADQDDVMEKGVWESSKSNGISKSTRARAGRNQKIPIIAMTAHAMKGDRERCLAAGMDDYISKPINPEELFKVIEGVANGLRDKDNKEKGMSPAAKDNKPIAKDIFDLSKALEVVDGDKDLLKEIAELFLENLPDSIAQIREAVANSDANALDKAAHSLKGSVGNFGTKRAFEAAYRLELMGKEGKLAEADAVLSELEKELKDLEAAMKEALSGDKK